jgi:hypothetical protein
MNGNFAHGVLLLTLTALPSWVANAQAAGPKSVKPESSEKTTTPFLTAVANIPTWASKMQTMLRDMGASIDRSKTINAILPEVEAIQRNLSELEDLNQKLDEELRDSSYQRTSAVQQKVPSGKTKAPTSDTLSQIKHQLFDMNQHFRTIRSNVQVLSIPELTGLERAAEARVKAKGHAVDDLISELGYKKSGDPLSNPTTVQLEARGAALDKLLHEAQDAFAQLHRALKNPDDLGNVSSKKS